MRLDALILFVDGEAIVLNKPAGLPVDAPRAGGDSIARRIAELKLNFQRLPTPMHRLDRDTSGCLLFARTPRARIRIQSAFETGAVTKVYWAMVAGDPGDGGLIDMPLAKTSTAETGWKMVGDKDGKSARTRWRRIATRIEDGRSVSLIEMIPETGRTHQLRVHAASGIGHPILGDPVYGVGDAAGMMLHARRLTVPRAPHETIDVVAPMPERFGAWDVDDAG